MTNIKHSILIVLPDADMRNLMLNAFQEHGCPFHYETVSSANEAFYLLSQRNFQAVVMTGSIALSGDNGTNGLITFHVGLPPTVTILQQGDDYPDYLYSILSINDWITAPFDLQEFYNRIFSVIKRSSDSRVIKISTKTELIATLKDANQRVTNWFTEIPVDDFFTRHGDVWSASDNVDHLIKSHKPIAKALRLPKFSLQAMFGRPAKPSMTYEELCQVYRDAVANGGQAFGRYLPDQQSPTDPEKAKSDLLNEFSKTSAELVSVVEKWNDNELDEYLLPHPLIGKLTIREMLFFTIYHNLRHASQEGD